MKPILIDTSSWILHFQGRTLEVESALKNQFVVTHEYILGELSLAHFNSLKKEKIFTLLLALHRSPSSTHKEVIDFVKTYKLAGKGIGWLDAHLLCSCFNQKFLLLSHDKNLNSLAKRIL